MRGCFQNLLGVLGFTLALVAALYVVALLSSWGPSRRQISSLRRQGAPIVEQVERYRASKGQYPATLSSAMGRDPESFYGPWGYKRSEDGSGYHLYTGDFITFILSYYSDSGWKFEPID